MARPELTGTGFLMGPIPGLTTSWHDAPEHAPIPVGTRVVLLAKSSTSARFLWSGAEEIESTSTTSMAACPIDGTGVFSIQVEVRTIPTNEHGNGDVKQNRSIASRVYACELVGTAIRLEDISVTNLELHTNPVTLSEKSSNTATMDYFFQSGSIAAVREIRDGHYQTSVHREITIAAGVEPASFAPLIEYRINGEAVQLGEIFEGSFDDIGLHQISAGPPAASSSITVETYRVTIARQNNGRTIIQQGIPMTFAAVTEPPGFEHLISWLSSTKHGTAVPILGSGQQFEAQFDNTYGADGQWVGVRADNAIVSQDATSYTDMVFNNANVHVYLPEGVIDLIATVNGSFSVSGSGVVNGSASILFGGSSSATMTVSNDATVISSSGTTMDFLVNNSGQQGNVLVNGISTPITTVIDQFVADVNATSDPDLWSDTSKIFLGALSIQSTSVWRNNVTVERSTCPALSPSSKPGFWCKVDATVGAAGLLLLTGINCSIITSACLGGLPLTLGGIAFLCGPLIAECGIGSLRSASGCYNYIISIWC